MALLVPGKSVQMAFCTCMCVLVISILSLSLSLSISLLFPPPSPVIAQYHEVAELAETTGRKMYVDPSIYASADEAVRDFAREIQPKFLSVKEEIGRGKSLSINRKS